MNGWIFLHRQLLDHELWLKQPFTWGQAWVDLLLLANHKETTIWIRGNEVPLKRGQVGWSIVSLSQRWRRSDRWVVRLLAALETRGQITVQKSSVTTVITIKNYDPFQSPAEQTTEQTTEQKQSRLRTDKNDKNEKNDKNTVLAAPEVLDESEDELRKLVAWLNTSKILPNVKTYTPAVLKKWRARRRTFSAQELAAAFANLVNEPDHWQINNNGFRELSWWLASDDRIRTMLNLHLKRGKGSMILAG